MGSVPDAFDLFPRFRHNAGRLEKNAKDTEMASHRHEPFRARPESFPGKPVLLLNSVLRIPAIATHVPFANGTARTGNRVWLPDDTND